MIDTLVFRPYHLVADLQYCVPPAPPPRSSRVLRRRSPLERAGAPLGERAIPFVRRAPRLGVRDDLDDLIDGLDDLDL